MDIYFGDYRLPKLLYYQADRDCRNTKKEYNANGDMIIDLVARKITLTVKLGMLNDEEMTELMNAAEPIFFPVTFYDPKAGEIVTKQFHMSEQPSRIAYANSSGKYFEELELTLEEK